MADEKLVAELAERLLREGYAIWHEYPDSHDEPDLDAARNILSWLAEQGRLIPAGAEATEQWKAWCHAGDSDGIVLSSEYAEPSLGRAEEWGREQIGRDGITRYTVVRREVHCWPDGTAMTTPWVPVPDNTEETTDA